MKIIVRIISKSQWTFVVREKELRIAEHFSDCAGKVMCRLKQVASHVRRQTQKNWHQLALLRQDLYQTSAFFKLPSPVITCAW